MKYYDFFVSGSGDSNLKLWNLSISWKQISEKYSKLVINLLDSKTLKGHLSDVYCVDVCENFIARLLKMFKMQGCIIMYLE